MREAKIILFILFLCAPTWGQVVRALDSDSFVASSDATCQMTISGPGGDNKPHYVWHEWSSFRSQEWDWSDFRKEVARLNPKNRRLFRRLWEGEKINIPCFQFPSYSGGEPPSPDDGGSAAVAAPIVSGSSPWALSAATISTVVSSTHHGPEWVRDPRTRDLEDRIIFLESQWPVWYKKVEGNNPRAAALVLVGLQEEIELARLALAETQRNLAHLDATRSRWRR